VRKDASKLDVAGVGRGGLVPPTLGLRVPCSTSRANGPWRAMLLGPGWTRGSAGLGDRRRRLGRLDLSLDRLAACFRCQCERLCKRQIALASLLGGVGGGREALVTVNRIRGRGSLDLPGVRLTGVVAQIAVGTRGEDRQIRVRRLGELDGAPARGGCQGELLLAAGCERVGRAIEVAARAGVLPASIDERVPGARVVGVLLGLLERSFLLGTDCLVLGVARAVAGEGVQQ